MTDQLLPRMAEKLALEQAQENLYEAELRGEAEGRLAVLRARVRHAERALNA
jgi:hypothetical protein